MPQGKENWRPVAGAMSFAEHAVHIVDCDNYLFDKMDGKTVSPVNGPSGMFEVSSRSEYDSLLDTLEQTGRKRAVLLENLGEDDFSRPINDRRFNGEVSLWWLIVRGNLDHEIHHRGQIAAYLRVAGIVDD